MAFGREAKESAIADASVDGQDIKGFSFPARQQIFNSNIDNGVGDRDVGGAIAQRNVDMIIVVACGDVGDRCGGVNQKGSA